MGIVSSIRHRIARARCILAQGAKAQSEAKAQARARLDACASACARRRRTDPVDKSACGTNPIRSRSHARNKPNLLTAPARNKPNLLQFAHAEQTQFASFPERGANPICFISERGSNPIEATENLQQSSKTCRNVQESSAPRSREKTKRTHYAGSCAARAGLRVRKLARPISENFRKLPIPHDPLNQTRSISNPSAGCATDSPTFHFVETKPIYP